MTGSVVASILEATFSILGTAIAALLLPLAGLAVLVTRRALARPFAEAVMLSLGAGIGLVAVVGLILAQTPIGLSPLVWLMFGAACIITVAVGARRGPAPAVALPWKSIGGVALIVAIGGSGLAIAREDAAEQSFSPFTAVAAVRDGEVVRISIHSWEETDQTFVLEARDGADVDRRWAGVRLAPGDSWSDEVAWSGDSDLVVTVEPVGESQALKVLTLRPPG